MDFEPGATLVPSYLFERTHNQLVRDRRQSLLEIEEKIALQFASFSSEYSEKRDQKQQQRENSQQEIVGQLIGSVDKIILVNPLAAWPYLTSGCDPC